MKRESMKRGEYAKWLRSVKAQIRRAQVKAAVRVNMELLQLYWDMGRDIAEKRLDAGYGSGFFERLSCDLKAEFPNMEGFSVTNLKYTKRFYLFYTSAILQKSVGGLDAGEIVQRGVVQLALANRHQPGDDLETGNILQQPVAKLNTAKSDVVNRQQVADEFGDAFFAIPWRHHFEIFTHANGRGNDFQRYGVTCWHLGLKD
ncbi:MAG: hypothetical protein IKR48_08210 [Kiritimatiellae bacterium]|nr:hypothetical protein [Kiritimatiellia bacterium]